MQLSECFVRLLCIMFNEVFTMIEGINFYLKELKRIKPIFKEDKTVSMIIRQLMFYGYNQRRLENLTKHNSE